MSSIIHCFRGRLKDKNKSYFLSKLPVVTIHFKITVAKQGKEASFSQLNSQQQKFTISHVLENQRDFEASDGFKNIQTHSNGKRHDMYVFERIFQLSHLLNLFKGKRSATFLQTKTDSSGKKHVSKHHVSRNMTGLETKMQNSYRL